MSKKRFLLVMLAALFLALAGCAAPTLDATRKGDAMPVAKKSPAKQALPPPDIKSMYLGSGTPTARPDSAQVGVFLRSEPPTKAYTTVGDVEISTEREGRSMENMPTYARQEARRMGGDALIVETESAGLDGCNQMAGQEGRPSSGG